MRYSLIIVLLTIGLFQTDKFGLKADLIKDKKRLAEEHGGTNINLKDLSVFEKYAAMDLSKFSVSKKVVSNNSVLKLTSKVNPKLILFKMETVLAGDTVYREKELEVSTGKPVSRKAKIIKLKPHDFVYSTYIIVPQEGEQMVYLSEKNDGLVEYRINGKRHYPLYESIALGQPHLDLNEIIKIAMALK